ncbi:hypothetical protein M5689_020411 [Euphorbia peplus]|nr:hypothetical protein M5689_020411 [Euphorbia peplus]
MYSSEKKCGTDLSENAQHLFRMCLLDCDLFDIIFKGSAYTWCNGRKGHEAISERLDRFVRTVDWDILFPNSVVFHLHKGTSDHAPLLLDTDGVRKDHFRPFRFEAMWIKEGRCKDIVDSAWKGNGFTTASSVMDKISKCATSLKAWNRDVVGNLGTQIRTLTERLESIEVRKGCAITDKEISEIESQLIRLQEKEEIKWHQRSRISWLKEGDRNTKFFHNKASTRRKINSLTMLKNEAGIWCEDEQEIESIVTKYYNSLFTTTNPRSNDMIEAAIESRLSLDDISLLSNPYTKEEVKAALDQMHPTKSPGPDGMPALFYSTFWDSIGEDVDEP